MTGGQEPSNRLADLVAERWREVVGALEAAEGVGREDDLEDDRRDSEGAG